MGMGFDWGYWFMTTLPFRPCDYALSVGIEDAQHLYADKRPKKVQERRAGDALRPSGAGGSTRRQSLDILI